MYHSILVPLDGSPFGEHALPLAAGIARRASATLHLVHVHVTIGGLGIDVMPSSDDSAQRERERDYLAEVQQRLAQEPGLAVTTTVLDDPVVEALHGYTVDHAIDLVAMTTHGRGALSRLWLGSVTDRLVRQSPAPVLLVRPEESAPAPEQEPPLKHVLVPLDGSALAEQILPRAVALGSLVQARYTLLQVAELALSGEGAELYGSAFDEEVQGRVRARSQRYLDHVAGPLRSEGLTVETATVFGWSAQDILTYAADQAVDAIALATHGRSGIARLLIGSVADKIVRGATVPVLLFRPHDVPLAAEDEEF